MYLTNLSKFEKWLINLKNKIDEQKTAKEITIKLYEFLEENNIRQKLEEKIQKLNSREEIKYANEYSSCWNILMEILDEVNLVFGNQKMTFEDYREILKSGLEVSAFGEIPESLDQVVIGDVERSRNHKVHTLFILGLNDGVFPNTNFAEGFLNDKDREYLKENGIELAKGTLENIYEDRFNIYKAFTTAENDMYLSYVSSDKEGKAKRPSTLITKIKKIFPKLIEESTVLENEKDITMPKDTFGELLINIRNSRNGEELDDIWKATYNWFIKNEEWKEKLLKAIKGYENKSKAEKISEINIQRLYGNILKTSVSRLEQYRRCPFSFHLKYGLKLKEKEDLKIKPLDTGSFMHDIIDMFFDEVKDIKNINDEQIEKVLTSYQTIDGKVADIQICDGYVVDKVSNKRVMTDQTELVNSRIKIGQTSEYKILSNNAYRLNGSVNLGKLSRLTFTKGFTVSLLFRKEEGWTLEDYLASSNYMKHIIFQTGETKLVLFQKSLRLMYGDTNVSGNIPMNNVHFLSVNDDYIRVTVYFTDDDLPLFDLYTENQCRGTSTVSEYPITENFSENDFIIGNTLGSGYADIPNIARIEIYNRVLSHSEIISLTNGCNLITNGSEFN